MGGVLHPRGGGKARRMGGRLQPRPQQGMTDDDYMAVALAEAEAAGARGEVPVGAVLAGADGAVLARDGNRIVERHDPTAHAEILVLRAAAVAIGNERLVGASLFVTLEPCAMCAGAASFARVSRVVFAADDPKGGAVLHGPMFYAQPTCHHRPKVERAGDAAAVSALLKGFFRARR
jgi:tRNA(adenine34) deaminase